MDMQEKHINVKVKQHFVSQQKFPKKWIIPYLVLHNNIFTHKKPFCPLCFPELEWMLVVMQKTNITTYYKKYKRLSCCPFGKLFLKGFWKWFFPSWTNRYCLKGTVSASYGASYSHKQALELLIFNKFPVDAMHVYFFILCSVEFSAT